MPPGIEIRPADRADVPAIRSVLAAHGNDGPVIVVDVVGPYVAHLIDHHRAMVTDGPEGIIAFGAVVDAGVATHLADLFVLPDRLGQGIGRPLLAALFGSDARRTTFASRDPRALPLYVRAGMSPLWAGLYVAGASTTLPAPPANVDLEAADPARLAAIELAWAGVDRSVDHAFWGSQGAADSFLVAVTKTGGTRTVFGYDPRGNMTTNAEAGDVAIAMAYAYDLGDKLTSINTAGTTADASFTYDALGRALTRSVNTSPVATVDAYAYAGSARSVVGIAATGGTTGPLARSETTLRASPGSAAAAPRRPGPWRSPCTGRPR